MSRSTEADATGKRALAELRRLRAAIRKADSAQVERLARRSTLAARARAHGAPWTAINEAAGVANMQATLSDAKRN